MAGVRRWRRRKGDPTTPAEPQVITVTDAVTKHAVIGLVSQVNRLAAESPVVLDLTAIPSFDTDGASELVRLQESMAPGRVTLVGFRQAVARLTGSEPLAADAPGAGPVGAGAAESGEPWRLRRLRAIAVVQPAGDGPASTDSLPPVLTAALEEEVGIVVVDLRGALLTPVGVDSIAFASSSAALSGQELLVVNVDAESSERLRAVGLSATTYVAPEPLPDF